MTRAVVIGLGNPLRSDDGVGLVVVRELRRALGWRGDVDIRELHAGGIAVVEACVGYQCAFVVDAMTARHRPGTIYRAALDEMAETRHCSCAHDTSLAAAFSIARFLQMPLPEVVRVWGVEPADVDTFSEALTEEVATAVPIVVAEIATSLDAAVARRAS